MQQPGHAEMEGRGGEAGGNPVSRLADSLRGIADGRRLPPVERWNPPFCGEIDMAIHSDGSWWYGGTPIGRPALVRLFASILRRDPDRFVLVTPVERVGIRVADAPFLVVEMARDVKDGTPTVAFRTNVDDLVEVGPGHPLRFEVAEDGGVKPYVLVRGGLWARATRSVAIELLDVAEEREVDGHLRLGIAAGHDFFHLDGSAGDIVGDR